MGYWVNTTYINHPSVSAVVETLVRAFAAEGMERVELPERRREAYDPMQYLPALSNDIWAVAVFPGAADWTVLQTAPLELLAEHVVASGERRIVAICKALQCSALMVNVYDSTGIILAECDSSGGQSLCGYNLQAGEADPYREYMATLTEESLRLQLRTHAWLGITFDEHELGEDVADKFAQRCAGASAMHCDNLVSVDTLICRKPLNIPGGEALYFKWTGSSRQRYVSLESFGLARS